MSAQDTRWKQRFQNLQKAFTLLQDAVLQVDQLSHLGQEGLIKRFEYTFELAWKTLKDYLEAQGLEVSFPKAVIKTAFAHGVIEDGEIWLEMLESRRLMADIYNANRLSAVVGKVTSAYFPALAQVVEYLEAAF